jgi:hypothetical protein
MDVGYTKSNTRSILHYVTGSIVFFSGYIALMFAIRDWLM